MMKGLSDLIGWVLLLAVVVAEEFFGEGSGDRLGHGKWRWGWRADGSRPTPDDCDLL